MGVKGLRVTSDYESRVYHASCCNYLTACICLFILQLKKTRANSLHLQKQFDHETRKKERELSKLKERIHQLLTDKNQEKKVGLDILNLINRPAGAQRAMWKTGSAK